MTVTPRTSAELADHEVGYSRNSGSGHIVLLLMMVVAFGHFNRVGISVAGAERIIPHVGITPEKMGLVYSAFLLCYTAAMLPGGWLIDRFGGRRALMVFLFGSSVFVALTGCVGLVCTTPASLWLGLLGVRSLLGVINAPLHPATARLVFEHVPASSRSFANGWATFAACLGISVTFYGLGSLIDLYDWPIAFLICSVVTLVAAIIWSVGTRSLDVRGSHGAGPRTMPSRAGMTRMLRQSSVLCITISYAALGYFQYLFFYWIEYYFEKVQHRGVDVARRYATLVTLAMGVGMVCGGWLADRVPTSFSLRFRRGLVPMVGMFASGAVFELGLLTSNESLTLAAFALAAAMIGACEGSFWTTVCELGGAYGGTAAGLMNTGGNAGGTLSPYLTPLLSTYFATHFGETVGWRLSLAVAGAIPILGAVLWWGVDPAQQVEQPAESS